METKNRSYRLRAVALPNEHGAWGFLLEPLAASLLIAPSFAAVFIVLLICGLFLTRQPLKVLLTDLAAGRWLAQSRAALLFVLGFSAIAVAGLAGVVYLAGTTPLIPLVLLLPFGAIQVYADVKKQARNLLPELTGVIAISASSAAVLLAGGTGWKPALALWGLLAARFVPSIVYVRNRLRLEKGKEYSFEAPVILSTAGLLFGGWIYWMGLTGYLPILVLTILLFRAALGLSKYRKPVKAMKIGIAEVVYGAIMVVALAVG
ncbi:MAG: YwiC-like family protein [Pyrinomonadaceae bacterium]